MGIFFATDFAMRLPMAISSSVEMEKRLKNAHAGPHETNKMETARLDTIIFFIREREGKTFHFLKFCTFSYL